MPSVEFHPKQIQSLCEKKARDWDQRLYYKRHKSNGMCVKVLFEIMSKISPIHNSVYQKIKKVIWSHWICMVNTTGVVDEFKRHGMKVIEEPVPGSFGFIRHGNIIGHVGLFVDKSKLYHLCKHGFICTDIKDHDIAYIGVF